MSGLAVMTAAGSDPTWGYMKSILGLRGPGDGGFGFVTAEGLGVEQARNLLVERFLQTPADWLLFVDRDALLHPQTAVRLLSWNVPVVAALSFTRNSPPMPTVYRDPNPQEVEKGLDMVSYRIQWEETRTWVAAHVELQEDGAALIRRERPDDALVRVDFTGMHCTLIRRDVLEGLRPGPWFERVHPIGGPRGAGEDYYFCRKVREAGYEIHVDRSVQAGHLAGERSIGGLAFLAWGSLANSESGGFDVSNKAWEAKNAEVAPAEIAPAKQPAAKYVALAPIDHTGDYRVYPAGSVIRLDHLRPAQIKILIDRGHVRPVESDGG